MGMRDGMFARATRTQLFWIFEIGNKRDRADFLSKNKSDGTISTQIICEIEWEGEMEIECVVYYSLLFLRWGFLVSCEMHENVKFYSSVCGLCRGRKVFNFNSYISRRACVISPTKWCCCYCLAAMVAWSEKRVFFSFSAQSEQVKKWKSITKKIKLIVISICGACWMHINFDISLSWHETFRHTHDTRARSSTSCYI